MVNEPQRAYFGRWVSLANTEDLPPPLRGQPALLPDLLGEDISLQRSTYRELATAQEMVGRLDAAASRLPHRDELGQMAQRLEARHSAELDGTVASTREALATGLPGSVTPVVDEDLKRYQRFYTDAAAAMLAGRPWDEVLVGRLSAVLTGSAFEGDVPWRARPAWLGDQNSHNAYLIATPPGSEMRELTREWCRWMNDERDWPVMAKVILGQLQVLVLAPVPGSAHLARLVPALELTRAGRLHLPVLPLSGWLWQHADEFPPVVRGVFDRGEINAWMTFVAIGIQTACARQIELIARLDEVCATMLGAVVRKSALVRLVEALTVRPIINLIEIADICGVASSHATTLARRLQQSGLAKILNAKTLESQPDDNSHGKVIVATGIVRLLGLFQPHPWDRDRDVLA